MRKSDSEELAYCQRRLSSTASSLQDEERWGRRTKDDFVLVEWLQIKKKMPLMSLAAVMGRAVQKTVIVFLPEFLFFNLRWHWRSLGSKTFMGEARVCPVCGAGFPPPPPSMPAPPFHLDPPAKKKTAFTRSNSTLFKAASGFPWCCAKTCPREKRKPERSPQHVELKNAYNIAAQEQGIVEVQCDCKRQNVRWKMEGEGGSEAYRGRWKEGDGTSHSGVKV